MTFRPEEEEDVNQVIMDEDEEEDALWDCLLQPESLSADRTL